jgi:hypothetical protein
MTSAIKATPPVSSRPRTYTYWVVIRTDGHGEVVSSAYDLPNAILRAACLYTRNDFVDWQKWWVENADKKHLIVTKAEVRVQTFRSTPHPGWNPTPMESRCEWDRGGLVEIQCENTGKHITQGRRLCTMHLKKAQRDGELRLIAPWQPEGKI